MDAEVLEETKERLKPYNDYIWAKYVDLQAPDEDIDEEKALGEYADLYLTIHPATDEECYFYGLLLFENAFNHDEPTQILYLKKAKAIFDIYVRQTGESDWDVISDRLTDIDSILEEAGEINKPIEQEWLAPMGFSTEETMAADPSAPDGMVMVPGGEFLYGTEKETRTTEAFYIDQYPTTNKEWKVFIESTNYRNPIYWDDKSFNTPNQPVVGVSYIDAQQYAKWAGKSLPSEEQWEKAARWTDGRTYPWGEAGPTEKEASFTPDDGDEKKSKLSSVGSHPEGASPYGVDDIAGMVWEWTTSPHEDHNDCKVIRGGSWVDPPSFLECSSRLFAHPKDKQNILGFRCVKKAD